MGDCLASGAVHAVAWGYEAWIAGRGLPRGVDQLLLVSDFLTPLRIALRADKTKGLWRGALTCALGSRWWGRSRRPLGRSRRPLQDALLHGRRWCGLAVCRGRVWRCAPERGRRRLCLSAARTQGRGCALLVQEVVRPLDVRGVRRGLATLGALRAGGALVGGS